jgi:hypothetical protein
MTSFEVVIKYTSAVMAALYIIIGGSLLWNKDVIRGLPPATTLTIGIVLILYGLFRGYNVYRKW